MVRLIASLGAVAITVDRCCHIHASSAAIVAQGALCRRILQYVQICLVATR